MNDKTRTSGTTLRNKDIDIFMGEWEGRELSTRSPYYLFYDIRWGWLMPVVDKIEGLLMEGDNSFNVTIGSGLYCTIQDAYGELIEINTSEPSKIEATYEAVLQFIKWYNKQQKYNPFVSREEGTKLKKEQK